MIKDTTLHAAVLADDTLMFLDGAGKLHKTCVASPHTFTDLCELGLTHGVRNIWLVPGSTTSEHIMDNPAIWIAAQSVGYKPNITTRTYQGIEYPVACFIHRVNGTFQERRAVSIFIPQVDDRWNEDKTGGFELAQVENPITLLGALHYLRETLGVDVQSPGHTGIELMKKATTSRPLWVQQADLSGLPAHIEVDIEYKRPLSEEEVKEEYVIVVDRNSQYLAATTGAWLGQGSPMCLSEHHLLTKPVAYDFTKPGVWHVVITGVPMHLADGDKPMVPMNKKVWMYAPLVQALIKDLRCTVDVLEGYVWEKGNKALEPWARGLWQSRTELRHGEYKNREAQEVAYLMIKRIATQAVGWLDITGERTRAIKSVWHRPDWKNQIVALARARMLLKIDEVVRKYGLLPCLVDTDTLVYISNNPNPYTAMPDLMVRPGGLGAFKHEGTYKLNADIITALKTKSVDEVKRTINKAEKVEVF